MNGFLPARPARLHRSTRKGFFPFFMSTRTPDRTGEELTWDSIIASHNEPQNGNPDIYWMEASFIDDLRPER